MSNTSANDIQVAGSHYRGTNAQYQHWDMVADVGIGYFDGQITKYIFRWKGKNGLQDLKKAGHFAQKYIEIFASQGPNVQILRRNEIKAEEYLKKFLESQKPEPIETQIISLLVLGHMQLQVEQALELIKGLVQAEEKRLEEEPPVVDKSATTVITLRQAKALVDSFKGLDREMCVAVESVGLVAWSREYPEDGIVPLGQTVVRVEGEATPEYVNQG